MDMFSHRAPSGIGPAIAGQSHTFCGHGSSFLVYCPTKLQYASKVMPGISHERFGIPLQDQVAQGKVYLREAGDAQHRRNPFPGRN